MYFPQKMTYNFYNQKQLNVKIKKNKLARFAPISEWNMPVRIIPVQNRFDAKRAGFGPSCPNYEGLDAA